MYADDISIYVMVLAPLKIELLSKRTKLILCNWSTQWCLIRSFDECEFYTVEDILNIKFWPTITLNLYNCEIIFDILIDKQPSVCDNIII